MRIQVRLAAILVVLALGAVGSVAAQGPVHVSRLQISIWPEYDQPAALVIIDAQLADDAPLPTTVNLPMPQSATLNAVAKRAPDGRLLMAEHTVENAGSWTHVNIVADLPTIRLEYYNKLSVVDTQRELLAAWPGGLEIDQLTYEVRFPPDATDLVVEPPPTARGTDANGLVLVAADLGAVPASSGLAVRVAYTKPTPELTVQAVGQRPAAPQAPPVTAPPAQAPMREPDVPPGPPQIPLWAVVLPIVVILGIVAWILFRQS